MSKIKICGITNVEDAKMAAELGADAIGFVFSKKSPRFVDKETAKIIINSLPPFIAKVGVFVDEDEDFVSGVQSYCGLTVLQFHGSETAEYCAKFRNVIKAIRVKDESDVRLAKKYEPYVSAILFDTYKDNMQGGTGETFDWKMLSSLRLKKPLILSGGINAENVKNAMDIVKPYAIDSASGTEASRPGKKDHEKMKMLIDIVKGVKVLRT